MNSNAGTLAESSEEMSRWNPWLNSKDCSTQTILARKAARDQALQRMQRIINSVSSSYFLSSKHFVLRLRVLTIGSIFMASVYICGVRCSIRIHVLPSR